MNVASKAEAFEVSLTNLSALIERVSNLFDDLVKEMLVREKISDINYAQAKLLFRLGDAEVTAGELGSKKYYQGTNVSYSIKGLVDAGYLHYKSDVRDRRAVLVRATQKGRNMAKAIAEVVGTQHETLSKQDSIGQPALNSTAETLRALEKHLHEQIRYIY